MLFGKCALTEIVSHVFDNYSIDLNLLRSAIGPSEVFGSSSIFNDLVDSGDFVFIMEMYL